MKLIRNADNLGISLGKFIPEWLIGLCMRIATFMVFWPSAQTKIDGGNFLGQKLYFWNVTDSTKLLFEHEYALPIIPADLAAYLASIGEFALSLFILLGIFTRLSAAGLLIMTLVIQVFVYPGAWALHLLWAAVLIYLIKHGAGSVSLDASIEKA